MMLWPFTDVHSLTNSLARNYVNVDSSYLKTLEQYHSSPIEQYVRLGEYRSVTKNIELQKLYHPGQQSLSIWKLAKENG